MVVLNECGSRWTLLITIREIYNDLAMTKPSLEIEEWVGYGLEQQQYTHFTFANAHTLSLLESLLFLFVSCVGFNTLNDCMRLFQITRTLLVIPSATAKPYGSFSIESKDIVQIVAISFNNSHSKKKQFISSKRNIINYLSLVANLNRSGIWIWR